MGTYRSYSTILEFWNYIFSRDDHKPFHPASVKIVVYTRKDGVLPLMGKIYDPPLKEARGVE